MSPPPYQTAPALAAALSDSNTSVTGPVATALSKMIDNPEVFQMLIKEADNSNAAILESLAKILAGSSTQANRAVPTLIKLLKYYTAAVRGGSRRHPGQDQ